MLVKRTLKIVTTTLVGILLIFMGLALFTARAIVFPQWYLRADQEHRKLAECSAYGLRTYVYCSDPRQSQNLNFLEFDADEAGIRTSGWWVPAPELRNPRGIVILVHGGGADRRAMLKHAGYLHRAGYHVLDIDCHNQGLAGNDGRGISLGLRESESVVNAAAWAQKNVPEGARMPIFAMGTSQGAFASLRAMAMSGLIRGVVAENPYLSVRRLVREFPALAWEPTVVKEAALVFVSLWLGSPVWSLDVRDFADHFGNRPVLLLHGTADRVTSDMQTRELYDLIQGPKRLVMIKDGEHEALWNIAREEYEDAVLKFLDPVSSPK